MYVYIYIYKYVSMYIHMYVYTYVYTYGIVSGYPGPVQLLIEDSSFSPRANTFCPGALPKLTSRFIGFACLHVLRSRSYTFSRLLQKHLHQQRSSEDTRANTCSPCIICVLITDFGVLLSSLLPFSSVLLSAHASKCSSRARTTIMVTNQALRWRFAYVPPSS